VPPGANPLHEVKSDEGKDDQREEKSTKAARSDFDLIPRMTRRTGHFPDDPVVELLESPEREKSQGEHCYDNDESHENRCHREGCCLFDDYRVEHALLLPSFFRLVSLDA